ncbi:MAG TPA: ABC transporter permease [Dehalococcoidia bacterium]|nr:ABC transporter permease [Dehalococcoidia bacterium]
MTRYIIIRLLQNIIALFGIIVIVFFLVRISGNPVMFMVSPLSTQSEIEVLQKQLGLDKSYGEQFWIFLTNLVQGDFGESFVKRVPVNDLIGQALPNTLKLGIPSFLIGTFISVMLGVLGATRRDSILDNGVKFLAVLGQALPNFWLAIMAVLVFSVYLGWLPTQGMATPAHYVLPVGSMVFLMLPGMMRLVRSTMLDVLDSEYVKLARIKGLPERTVIWKHALKNALISPLTVAGLMLAGIVSGSIITENIFNWPGMGRLAVESAFGRDFPVVQAISIIAAAMVLGMNFLVDIAYAWIDPQIRYQRS